jgi:hypothetical protein
MKFLFSFIDYKFLKNFSLDCWAENSIWSCEFYEKTKCKQTSFIWKKASLFSQQSVCNALSIYYSLRLTRIFASLWKSIYQVKIDLVDFGRHLEFVKKSNTTEIYEHNTRKTNLMQKRVRKITWNLAMSRHKKDIFCFGRHFGFSRHIRLFQKKLLITKNSNN